VNGLRDDAWTEIQAIVDKGIYFEDPSRTHGVQIDSFKMEELTKGKDWIVCSIDHSCYFTLPGLTRFFGWTTPRMQSFIDRLLAKMIELDPTGKNAPASWFGSWEINATARAFERYRPKDKKFATQIEKWILLSYFYDKNYFLHYLGEKWYKQWLNFDLPQRGYVDIEDRETVAKRDVPFEGLKYAALARRLEQLGMSKEEIREAFYRWLDIYSTGGLDLYFVAALLESNVLPHRSDRKTQLLRKVTGRVWHYFNQFYIVSVIAEHGMNTDIALRSKYASWLSDVLAKGRIGYASQANQLVGQAFFGKEKFELDAIAALAFDKAFAGGNLGVAAALVLQFGDEACFDEKILSLRATGKNQRERKQMLSQLVEERKTQIRESFGIAKAAGQPIRLDYRCSFLKPY
jgi:hypothetical protein